MQLHSFNAKEKERKRARAERSGGSVIRGRKGRKRQVTLKLAIVARRLRLRFDQRTEQIGLTRAQWSVLAVVSQRPGATQRTLANLLFVTDVTAGRMIDRLCADGYVERRENPDDRRAYRVFVTEKAKPVLAAITKLAKQFEQELFEGFADEDLDRLEELLGLMTRNLRDPTATLDIDKT